MLGPVEMGWFIKITDQKDCLFFSIASSRVSIVALYPRVPPRQAPFSSTSLAKIIQIQLWISSKFFLGKKGAVIIRPPVTVYDSNNP